MAGTRDPANAVALAGPGAIRRATTPPVARYPASASRRLGVQEVDEPVGRDHHGIMAGLDLDHVPSGGLDPIAARFQRLVDRVGAHDVARRHAVADLVLEL